MGLMRNRRLLPAAMLATLGVALWLAPAGLALRNAVVKQVFNGKLVRLEVIEKKPVAGSTDWRIDHGVIMAVSATQLTLRESDGRIQPIPLSSSTLVFRHGRILSPDVLAARWHVVVTWPASGAAQGVDVEFVPPQHAG